MADLIKIGDFRKTIEFELPSFPGSKIDIVPSLLVGEWQQITVSKDDPNFAVISLTKYIKEWNLAGEDGNLLPINEDSIRLLPIDDLVQLMNKINDFSKEAKKN